MDLDLGDAPYLRVPAAISPVFREQEGRFGFEVVLTNQHPNCFHFYIASTFGYCLKETTKARKIEGNSSITLAFTLKQTNFVGGGQELLAIYAGKNQIFELFPAHNNNAAVTKLQFDEETQIDPVIFKILEEEANLCLEEVQKAKLNEDYPRALSKSEEAYQILRKSQKAVNSLIDCRLLLKDYAGAVQDIESILITNIFNFPLLTKKLKIILLWQHADINHNSHLFDCIKSLIDFIEEGQHLLNMDDLNQLEEAMGEFKKYAKVVTTSQSISKQCQFLYDQAVKGYDATLPLASYYPSKADFERQMKEMLLSCSMQDISTPDEVVDPISYQIMKKPFIIPSGTSIEQFSLKSYFKTNGYKDPITRKEINPGFVFPNHAFRRYIQEHAKLKQWEKYEYDFINN